ncbi:MAG: lipopolysaccharide heptosyltransferase family protein [Bacteroidetes bacterium]|nr:MAG: lipopolysaccharide heptosyltransferase family protein [Bacteroidota bacterium]
MKRIIISRTDNLGDVILTLPMAGILKKEIPGCYILFLGKKYTKPLIDACEYVDEFLDWDDLSSIQHPASSISAFNALKADVILHVFPVKDIQKLAKAARIPLRIGTSHRWYSWLYCNKLVHYSRKKSDLHEVQLNLKLLEPLGITKEFTLSEIASFYGLTKLANSPVLQLASSPARQLTSSVFNLILHPKSKGSAREWGLDNFSRLIGLLPEDKFRIFITGTKEEGALMKDFLYQHRNRITDMTGKLSLTELLVFINSSDGMVAASTGPLHIAAALGKRAIGIYAPMRPIFPARWAPLGENATYLVLDKKCDACRKSDDCECIRAIRPEEVAEKLMS